MKRIIQSQKMRYLEARRNKVFQTQIGNVIWRICDFCNATHGCRLKSARHAIPSGKSRGVINWKASTFSHVPMQAFNYAILHPIICHSTVKRGSVDANRTSMRAVSQSAVEIETTSSSRRGTRPSSHVDLLIDACRRQSASWSTARRRPIAQWNI